MHASTAKNLAAAAEIAKAGRKQPHLDCAGNISKMQGSLVDSGMLMLQPPGEGRVKYVPGEEDEGEIIRGFLDELRNRTIVLKC